MSQEQIEAVLGEMSAKQVTKLTQVVERDRSQKMLGLPHEKLLELLRPRLATVKPERYWSPMRLFCLPFEDQLHSVDPSQRKSGQICRAALNPVWTLLTEHEDIPEVKEACAEITKLVAKNKLDDAYVAARKLWKAAAERFEFLLQDASDDAKTDARLGRQLGTRQFFQDLRLMADAMFVADEILQLRRKFPERPVRALFNDDCIYIRDLVNQTAEAKPGREAAVLLSLTSRLLRASEIFKVLRLLTSQTDDTGIADSGLGVAGDVVLERLNGTVRDLQNAQSLHKTDEEILEMAKEYAREFGTITGEFNIRKEGRWGQTLLDSRKEVSAAIAKTMFGKTPERVMESLPMADAPKTGAPRGGVSMVRPLVAKEPDEVSFLQAEKSAKAIAECARIAHVLSAQSSATRALTDLRKRLDSYGRAYVEGARKVKADEKDTAVRNLMATVRLIEIVSGSEDADLVRRRGMAALRDAS